MKIEEKVLYMKYIRRVYYIGPQQIKTKAMLIVCCMPSIKISKLAYSCSFYVYLYLKQYLFISTVLALGFSVFWYRVMRQGLRQSYTCMNDVLFEGLLHDNGPGFSHRSASHKDYVCI